MKLIYAFAVFIDVGHNSIQFLLFITEDDLIEFLLEEKSLSSQIIVYRADIVNLIEDQDVRQMPSVELQERIVEHTILDDIQRSVVERFVIDLLYIVFVRVYFFQGLLYPLGVVVSIPVQPILLTIPLDQ